jgi:hypothetical protein
MAAHASAIEVYWVEVVPSLKVIIPGVSTTPGEAVVASDVFDLPSLPQPASVRLASTAAEAKIMNNFFIFPPKFFLKTEQDERRCYKPVYPDLFLKYEIEGQDLWKNVIDYPFPIEKLISFS